MKLFLSPVVNMKIIIDNLMVWSNTTEEQLKFYKEWLNKIIL